MDRHALLRYDGGGRYPLVTEPDCMQMPNGTSGASLLEGEVSSESTDEKPPRIHIMAGHAPAHVDPVDSSDSDPFGSAVPEENAVAIMTPRPQKAVRYRECLRNHAASMGGHALDGCGDFLPGGKDGIDPLKCAACSCHRNFHRKEVEGEYACAFRRNPKLLSGSPTPLVALQTSRDVFSHAHIITQMSSLEGETYMGPTSSRKRRHRTSFSAEQKQSMMTFAEKLKWKMLKQDEDEVQAFSEEMGISPHVFKVWMHNHRHSSNK